MKTIKFVVKVNRGDVRAPEYVQRIDRIPVQMTTNRSMALLMGDSQLKTRSNPCKRPGAAPSWFPSQPIDKF